MILRHGRNGLVLIALGWFACAAGPAQAQQPVTIEEESWLEWLNPFKAYNPNQPVSIPELCKRLDWVAERMRDDGLVVLKQPDVFSQARLTRFRNDFDNQVSSDLGNFHLVLAARINRLDAATTTQSTALSAALAAPGTTNVSTPPPLPSQSAVTNNGTSLFPSPNIDLTRGVYGSIGLAANSLANMNAPGNTALGLGVDPTVYLDEKKRFLEHLNHIRRISLGPDQNDSSGYGLYLLRLPVSITPGEKTYHGFGAEVAMHVEHEFTPNFLPATFRSLVINDVVDQLGPLIYEVIRSGFYDQYLKPLHDAKVAQRGLAYLNAQQIDSKLDGFPRRLLELINQQGAGSQVWSDLIVNPISKFIFDPLNHLNGDPANDDPLLNLAADRLTILANVRQAVPTTFDPKTDEHFPAALERFGAAVAGLRAGRTRSDEFGGFVHLWVSTIVRAAFLTEKALRTGTPLAALTLTAADTRPSEQFVTLMRPLYTGLYQTALPGDIKLLNIGLDPGPVLPSNFESLKRLNWLNLPSVRTAKQLYPIAPRELLNFFLDENIYLLAKEAKEASQPNVVRAADVRNYMRATLSTAYDVMTYRTPAPNPLPPGVGAPAPPPLDQDDFLEELLHSVWKREFNERPYGGKSHLEKLYDRLLDSITRSPDNRVAGLPDGRANIRGKALGALCWSIALDAVLLDRALQADAQKVFAAKEIPADLQNVHFYHTEERYKFDPQAAQAVGTFQEYVRLRWPVITFGLDPVTDQQNIADSFNLKRDLQLALSFAFATGQIGFNQLNTFRRQIEVSADTIALNRTVTGFAHGDDIFGFRFTPRFQNPPNQRTNIGVIASQLIGGGPGPDYQLKKSKLESGMRELTAVVLIPSFLTELRLDVTSNWFRLNDPEHLVFHSKRAMEQGRRVQELKRTLLDPCSEVQYRDVDRRVLRTKLEMVEAMLPWQTKVVQLPFENSASGFDLFSDGATALVPELTGYSGVDVITTAPAASAATAAVVAGTAGLQIVNTNTFPSSMTTTSVVGGAASVADIFVFGKYISLLDTKVIAGGRAAAFEILSREVIHVQIPANFIPTKTEEGNQYVEVYLATPNGVTNSLLIPYQPPGTPPPQSLYDLATKSQSIDVYYQWLDGPNNTHSMVSSSDPGVKATVDVTWDDATGLGPKTLQVTFQGTVGSQTLSFALTAQPGNSGDFSVSQQQFMVALLRQLQSTVTYPAALTTPVPLTLWVQPWVPYDAQGVRTRLEPKQVKTPLTVNLHYSINATNPNPLQSIVIPPPPPPAQPAGGAGAAAGSSSSLDRKRDEGLLRTAQDSPPAPPALNMPQPPVPLNTPTLLSPNVTTEAEQVARMLTGQAFNPNGSIPTVVPPAATAAAGSLPTTVANPPTTVASTTTSTAAATAGVAPIIVMPAPVVVIPAKPDVKATHRRSPFHRPTMLQNLGNRINQLTP